MENLKYSIQKNKKFILILLACVVFTSIATILIFDNSTSSKTQNVFSSIVNNINKSNASLDNCLKDSTINTTVTVETLKDNINSLEKYKKTLSATVITNDTDRLLLSKVISAIESTQDLYNYCIESLATSEKRDFTQTMSQLTERKNNCIEYYNDLSDLGMNIKFSKSNLEFFDSFLSYLSTLDKLTKHQEIKDLQTKEFFNSFNTAITDFTNLLQDLQPAVTKVRSDNRSFDVLINDITEKELDFIMIKRNLSYISIPENCLTYYNNLNDTFNIYSAYLSSMKTALIYEKSSTSYEDNKKAIDENYSNAYSKYHDVKESLDSLNNSLENL